MKLSVIVPTWNNAELLIRMVNSMTRIGFFRHNDRELIIVNNGKQPCDKETFPIGCPHRDIPVNVLFKGLDTL